LVKGVSNSTCLIQPYFRLTQGFANLTWQSTVMILIGCVLLYLGLSANRADILIPIGFGIVLGNLPLAGLAATDQGGIIIFSTNPVF